MISKATVRNSSRTMFHGISYNRITIAENPASQTLLSVWFIPLKKIISTRVNGVNVPV